jgi:hypothetical protein
VDCAAFRDWRAGAGLIYLIDYLVLKKGTICEKSIVPVGSTQASHGSFVPVNFSRVGGSEP